MPENGELITVDYTSSLDNLKLEDWAKVQMTNTLRLLSGNMDNDISFYRIEGDKIVYNINLVKDYLSHICKREDGSLKDYRDMTDDIWVENIKAGNEGSATTSWTTAVQIALEYLGYDVGKIDGNRGLNTETAIRKFQKDNNLPVDGDPGPKVIESIINNLDDESLIGKRRLNTVVAQLQENGKNLGLNKCFEINSDGSLKFGNDCINLLEDRFIDMIRDITLMDDKEMAKNYIKNLKCPISDIFNGVIKKNENRVFEIDDNGNKKIIPFGTDSFGEKILDILISFLADEDSEKVEIKIVPNFMMGLDGCFLNKEDAIDTICFLRESGITTEGSKPFLDGLIKLKNIGDYKDIDLKNLLFDDVDSQMLKFLFGDSIDFLEPLLPISGFLGLMFYKLKTMWGEGNFQRGIQIMINSGILKCSNSHSIINMIKSNVTFSELPKYLELTKYLNTIDEHNKDSLFPDLKGYTPEEYHNIVNYMEKQNIGYDDMQIYGIKICEILFKNGIPGDAIYFINNHPNSPRLKLYGELFNNKEGKELYLFLSQYPQTLKNLGGKEIKQIPLNTHDNGYNFCFRGILEMIKSTGVEIPNFKRDGKQKWKGGREIIIKEYENLLRDYISGDKDENGNEIPRNQTFDKVFYANAVDHKYDDRSRALQKTDTRNILKNFTNEENFEDCSSVLDEDGNIDQANQKEMISKIKEFVAKNPDKKVLVYIGTHGGKDGSSSNDWVKENWLELANISPNITIMSPRCYFGGAYTGMSTDENYIYGLQSPVSGFSNKSSTNVSVLESFQEGCKKGLGFHETQIYTRLHYEFSFTPLTEYMDYRDFRSGKTRHGLVGLADAGMQNGRDDIV